MPVWAGQWAGVDPAKPDIGLYVFMADESIFALDLACSPFHLRPLLRVVFDEVDALLGRAPASKHLLGKAAVAKREQKSDNGAMRFAAQIGCDDFHRRRDAIRAMAVQ